MPDPALVFPRPRRVIDNDRPRLERRRGDTLERVNRLDRRELDERARIDERESRRVFDDVAHGQQVLVRGRCSDFGVATGTKVGLYEDARVPGVQASKVGLHDGVGLRHFCPQDSVAGVVLSVGPKPRKVHAAQLAHTRPPVVPVRVMLVDNLGNVFGLQHSGLRRAGYSHVSGEHDFAQ